MFVYNKEPYNNKAKYGQRVKKKKKDEQSSQKTCSYTLTTLVHRNEDRQQQEHKSTVSIKSCFLGYDS